MRSIGDGERAEGSGRDGGRSGEGGIRHCVPADSSETSWRLPFLKISVEYSDENHYNESDGGKQGAQEAGRSGRLRRTAAPSFRLEERNIQNG